MIFCAAIICKDRNLSPVSFHGSGAGKIDGSSRTGAGILQDSWSLNWEELHASDERGNRSPSEPDQTVCPTSPLGGATFTSSSSMKPMLHSRRSRQRSEGPWKVTPRPAGSSSPVIIPRRSSIRFRAGVLYRFRSSLRRGYHEGDTQGIAGKGEDKRLRRMPSPRSSISRRVICGKPSMPPGRCHPDTHHQRRDDSRTYGIYAVPG